MTSMCFLRRRWLLLALSQGLACSWALSNTPTPGVTEVDLIFPHNETYPPSPLTPFVFAIQNPSLLSSIHPRIFYNLEQHNVSSEERVVSTVGMIKIPQNNYTSSDPYFFYWSTGDLDNIEGTFLFAWELHMHNCSYNPESESVMFGNFGVRRQQVYFSTKNGTSPPDLVAATEDDACDQSQAQAVHVADLLDVPPTKTWFPSTETWGAPSCAVTLDTSPTPSPCKVKIDSSAAASISAALTSTACAFPSRTGLSCPSPTPENAASTSQLPVSGAWVLTIATLLAYSLA